MCEPTTLTALAVASAAAGQFAQFQGAQSQVGAINEQLAQNAQQTQAETEVAIGQRAEEARREAARFRVAAGESGVAGASVAAGEQSIAFQRNRDTALLEKQRQLGLQSAETQARARASAIQAPNVLTAGLQIASAGAGTFATARARQNPLAIPSGGRRSVI